MRLTKTKLIAAVLLAAGLLLGTIALLAGDETVGSVAIGARPKQSWGCDGVRTTVVAAPGRVGT